MAAGSRGDGPSTRRNPPVVGLDQRLVRFDDQVKGIVAGQVDPLVDLGDRLAQHHHVAPGQGKVDHVGADMVEQLPLQLAGHHAVRGGKDRQPRPGAPPRRGPEARSSRNRAIDGVKISTSASMTKPMVRTSRRADRLRVTQGAGPSGLSAAGGPPDSGWARRGGTIGRRAAHRLDGACPPVGGAVGTTAGTATGPRRRRQGHPWAGPQGAARAIEVPGDRDPAR